ELFEKWCADPVQTCPPGGEAAADMAGRIQEAVKEMSASLEAGQAAAVFTHGGVIRVAVTTLMGFPPVTAARLQIDPGSVTVTENVAGHWRLVRLNDTCHLLPDEDCKR
ncbi:MAG: histidine phosphatase family protein, partial [Bacillota bacterium]|nr:histidine phosphatase family protein [Bacillota bacterium]